MPEWFSSNAALMIGIILAAVTILVVWVVQRTAIRVALVGIAVVLALFVYANRSHLEVCARTCECQLAGQDISVPVCDPEDG